MYRHLSFKIKSTMGFWKHENDTEAGESAWMSYSFGTTCPPRGQISPCSHRRVPHLEKAGLCRIVILSIATLTMSNQIQDTFWIENSVSSQKDK